METDRGGKAQAVALAEQIARFNARARSFDYLTYPEGPLVPEKLPEDWLWGSPTYSGRSEPRHPQMSDHIERSEAQKGGGNG